MKKWRKALAAALTAVVLTSSVQVPTFAAQNGNGREGSIRKIDNGYIQYTINTANGAFSIQTVSGHPQKSQDDNKVLLYEGGGTETSFTTIRIDGEDYVFGQDYGFFGIDSRLDSPIEDLDENSISITYHIKGIAVTQKVMISDDPNNELCGNAGVGYSVVNESAEGKTVGLRTLLDSAIGDNDAPYMMEDAQATPIKTEKELKGDAVPTQIRGLNATENPSQMSYLFLDGWNSTGAAKPDRVILGHWANLANTRYEYVPNKDCDFSNYSNEYRVPDSAISMYWSEQELAAGGERTGEFLYGIGNFTQELKSQLMNINMTVQKVSVREDRSGYENDGVFEVTAEIDNTVDGAAMIVTPTVKISMESGLSIVEGKETEVYANIPVGQTKMLKWKLKADNQKKITAKEISVMLTTGEDAISASRFVILPSVSGEVPNISFTKVTPEKYYYEGEKNITVSGDMKELMEALKRKEGWEMKLKHQETGEEVLINKEQTAFVGEGKNLSLTTETEMNVGRWDIIFLFTNEDLVTAFGREIRVPKNIEVTNDIAYKSKGYAIMAIERYNTDQYRWVNFKTEEERKDYRETNDLNDKDASEREILLEIRGKVQEYTDTQGATYYAADPLEGNGVVLNNTAQYSTGDPLVIKQTQEGITIVGKGKLSVVNNMTFWNSNFEIKFTNGDVKTLNPEKVNGDSDTVRIDYTGIGSIIQNLAGFAINLKYGEFAEIWNGEENQGYAIDFGGKIALSFMKKQPGTQAAPEGTPPAPDTGGGPATGPEEAEEEEYTLSAEIDNVLFGQKEEIVDFLGINASVNVGLPSDAFGGFVKNPPLEASLIINTLEDIYEVSLGVDLFVVSCNGTLRVKVEDVNGVKAPLPDKFEFGISTSAGGVPIVPPTLFLTGLSGGYDNLASTVTGNYTDGLPDLTLLLGAKLNLIQVLEGSFNMEIGLKGLKMDGKVQLANLDGVSIDGGLEARWIDPFYIHAYGAVNVFEIIKGGVSMTIADNYFYGYGFLSLAIPDSIPLIGGYELAKIEGAVSTQFIGMNFKIIGIKMGVAYYWNDGDVDFGGSVDLSENAMQKSRKAFYYDEGSYQAENGGTQEYTAAYGTNFRTMKVAEVKTSNMQGKSRSFRGGFTENNSKAVSLNPGGQDALLLEVAYSGTGIVTADTLEFTIDGEKIPLIQDTTLSDAQNPVEGNLILQEREGKKYIYITITEDQYLEDEVRVFKLASSSDKTVIEKIGVNSVANLPEIASISMGSIGAADRRADIAWTLEGEGEKSKSAEINLYLTDDKSLISKLQNGEPAANDDLGIFLGTFKASDKRASVTIPDTVGSGEYYLVGALLVQDAGTNVKMTGTSQKFTNQLLPIPVKDPVLKNAGDGRLRMTATEELDADYTHYSIRLLDSSKNEVENSVAYYAKGDEILLGGPGKCTLMPGESYQAEVQTVREREDGGRYYSDEKVLTSPIVAAAIKAPLLEQMDSNTPGKGEVISNNQISLAYTFDQPVNFQILVDQVQMTKNEGYQKEWTFAQEFEDGEHLVTMIAVNEQGDHYIEGAQKDASMGFIVDTTPPQLSIGQAAADNVMADSIGISGQTVYVTGGRYRIIGTTEAGCTLLLDGSNAGVTIDGDGRFTIEGIMDMENRLDCTLPITVTDKAGNVSDAQIYFVNGDVGSFQSLTLMKKGNEGLEKLKKGEQGYSEAAIQTGESLQLVPVATFVDAEGKEKTLELLPTDVEWTVTGTGNANDFVNGIYFAKTQGTICAGAMLTSGIFINDGGESQAQLDDMVTIKVTGDEVSMEEIPEMRLLADTESISKSQLVTISPIMPDGESVQKVEVSRDNGKFEDITDSFQNGYLVIQNGTYVFRITATNGRVSSITDEYAAITFSKIDTNQPLLAVEISGYTAGTWTGDDVILHVANTNNNNLGVTTYFYSEKENPAQEDWMQIEAGTLKLTSDVNYNYAFKAVSESGVESTIERIKICIDKSAPEGTIQVAKSTFKSFLNWITADHYFDKSVNVTIDAKDAGSGVKSVEYLVTDKSLTEAELEKSTWIPYEKFSLNPDEKAFVYAKITDELGHISTIRTDGMILDGKVPKLKVTPDMDMKTTFSPKEVRVAIEAKDDFAGINTVTYRTDEAVPQLGTIALDKDGKGSILMKNNGSYHLTITVYDNTLKGEEGYNSGNPVVVTLPVKIDAVKPVFTIDTQQADLDKWTKKPLNITIRSKVENTSGQSLEISKNGKSQGIQKGKKYTIKENGTYEFVLKSGAGHKETRKLVIKKIDMTAPNAPSISDPGRYANQWYEQAQTVKVTFEKTEGCEEWLEVSYDGSNYERADGMAGILVKNTGSNKLYVRVTDELGRSSQVNSVTVNIGKGTNNGSGAGSTPNSTNSGSTPNSKTGGSAKTGDTMGERIIPLGILMAASLLAISGLCIKKRRKRTRG